MDNKEKVIKGLIQEAWNEGDINPKDKFGDFLNRAALKICQLFEPKGEKPPVLSEIQLEEIFENSYLEACEFSERYPTGLSPGHWSPERPAARLRYYAVNHREDIQRKTAEVQRDADVPYIEQARQVVAAEIFEEIDKVFPGLKQPAYRRKRLQALKGKFLKEEVKQS